MLRLVDFAVNEVWTFKIFPLLYLQATNVVFQLSNTVDRHWCFCCCRCCCCWFYWRIKSTHANCCRNLIQFNANKLTFSQSIYWMRNAAVWILDARTYKLHCLMWFRLGCSVYLTEKKNHYYLAQFKRRHLHIFARKLMQFNKICNKNHNHNKSNISRCG